MKKLKLICKPSGLGIIMTFIIFIVLVIGNAITFFIITTLHFKNMLPSSVLTFYSFLFYLLVLSTLVSTVITLLFAHIPLNPLNKLIQGMNELSKGNFDIRLQIHPASPRSYKQLIDIFNQTAQTLSSNELLRTDFINNFSHEFRTPIVSIRGFAKILKYNELTDSERTEYLDIIINESTRLSALANNVLNLSKVESQNTLNKMNRFNVAEQIRKCILVEEPQWESKNIELEINLEETEYYGNEELLTQVWINLLDNAIKFSPENGSIFINLSSTHQILIFSITDNGCGIPAEKQEHIYDKFYQCDTSHSTAGNGLGLSIVQKVVALHNGKITVDSAPDKGTTFIVTLPNLSQHNQSIT